LVTLLESEFFCEPENHSSPKRHPETKRDPDASFFHLYDIIPQSSSMKTFPARSPAGLFFWNFPEKGRKRRGTFMGEKRSASIMIEILFAFIVVSVAVSITLLSATQVSGVERMAQVKSQIYDVAYSFAEECVMELPATTSSVEERGGLTFEKQYATGTLTDFFEQSLEFATLTVFLQGKRDEFCLQMVVIPEQ